MEATNSFKSGKEPGSDGDLWYVDNYILLKDYYDRTISRIAARCVRQGNIALEEYPFYGYILDLLEEITETGDYIMDHANLHPYVEKKMAGGVNSLRKNLNEFKTELQNNASPDMIKQDKDELDRIKEALGAVDKSQDPTVGAGMSMDEVVEKLMQNQQNDRDAAARMQTQTPVAPTETPQPQNQINRPQNNAAPASRPQVTPPTSRAPNPGQGPNTANRPQQGGGPNQRPTPQNAGQGQRQNTANRPAGNQPSPVNPAAKPQPRPQASAPADSAASPFNKGSN